jgi:ParB family chromosome partitioning protein
MGKMDDLTRALGGNVAESMGVGRRAPTAAAGSAPAAVPERMKGVNRTRGAVDIPTDRIDRDPDQPREVFDEGSLARLAESLKARGQLQPIRARWDEGRGVYVIIAGERRWRAARMAGLATVSAVLVEGEIPPAELLALQLVENCLREDLRPVEQARAYRALIDRHGWSIRQLAAELALDHTAVSRALSLLDLPGPVQARVEQGEIPAWTAYEIVKAETPEAQAELAERVVAEGLTRAETVAAVKRAAGGAAKGRAKGKGATKARKVTTTTLRTAAGPRVTVEFRKGLDDALTLVALEDAASQIRARLDAGDQAAA